MDIQFSHAKRISHISAMLSDSQVQAIVKKVNKDVNLPFVREERESQIIENVVQTLNPHLEPALNSVCGPVYAKAIKTALNESLSIQQRRKEITELLRGELSLPLAEELNRSIDISVLPEGSEGAVMKVVADEMIEEFVEWVVGKIDEEIDEGLGP